VITEPAINTLPDNPLKIYQHELPIRIEAAIQDDYNYSDFYTYIPSGSRRDNKTFIYLYEGCKSTCLPVLDKNLRITINGIKQEYHESTCMIASGFPADLQLNITLSAEYEIYIRYALLIFLAPRGSEDEVSPPPVIPCTPYFQHYEYYYPPVPYTGIPGDPFGRSTCYEPPLDFGNNNIINKAYMGPYTVPLAIKFDMISGSGWFEQHIEFYINRTGTYDLAIRETSRKDTPCIDDAWCTEDLRFSLSNEDGLLSADHIYNLKTPGCYSNWRLTLPKIGHYGFNIHRKNEDGSSFDTFTLFIAHDNTQGKPFSGNCLQTYQGPCRRAFPSYGRYQEKMVSVLWMVIWIPGLIALVGVFTPCLIKIKCAGVISTRFPQFLGFENFCVNLRDGCRCCPGRGMSPVPQDDEEEQFDDDTISTVELELEEDSSSSLD